MGYSYLGEGQVYIKEKGANASLLPIGNCSSLTFSVNEDVKTLNDYTTLGGGVRAQVRRIASVEMQITMTDFSPENIARAVYGSVTSNSSGSVADEEHTAYKSGYIITKTLSKTITSVKNDDGTTTYVLGTDYELIPGGIRILDGGAITDASTIKISYDKSNISTIEAITQSGKEYEIVFVGLNEARSGKKTTIRAHRVKMGAAQNLGLIGDDFGSIPVTAELLKDTSIITSGISQYFKAEIEG